jgi:formiminotetrahydrofolate cyclodeaminase
MSEDKATDLTLREYLDRLAAKLPAPGGGSASALVGATGAALAAMVANFTIGQEKFAAVHDDVARLLQGAESTRVALMDLVQADIDAYTQVSAAYKLPKDHPARSETLQAALTAAAAVPLQIMEQCLEALNALPELLDKGNPNLVSDVGVAAACLECALRCAWLNVEINLAYISDEEYVSATRRVIEEQMAQANRIAREVWHATVGRVVKQ